MGGGRVKEADMTNDQHASPNECQRVQLILRVLAVAVILMMETLVAAFLLIKPEIQLMLGKNHYLILMLERNHQLLPL